MGIEVFTFPQIKLLKQEGNWTSESAGGKLTLAAAAGGRQWPRRLVVVTETSKDPETGEQGGGHDQPREGR